MTGTLANSITAYITYCAVNPTPLFSTLSQLLIFRCRLATGLIRELRSIRKVRSYSASVIRLSYSYSRRAATNLLKKILIVASSGFLSNNFMEASLWN